MFKGSFPRPDDYEKASKPGSGSGLNVLLSANKVSVTLAALIFLLVSFFVYPWGAAGEDIYAVVFDAGSTGSRVHVLRFQMQGTNLDLKEEIFEALKPGFRAYPLDPQAAANSLDPLLEVVRKHVPESKRATTPMTLRATAGIRLLPEGPAAAQAIMGAVAQKIKAEGFYYEDDYVSVLGGDMEGLFGWLAVNYLTGKLGKSHEHTVAMTDMGGGSMQLAYAVSDEVAAAAPESYIATDTFTPTGHGYIKKVNAGGGSYNLYVHSYAGYGIMAGRAKILQETADADGTHSCVPKGFSGGCQTKCYGLQPGEGYAAVAREEGANFDECLLSAVKALHKSKPCAREGECSFNGEWSPPMKQPLYAMSYFYERPEQSLASHPSKPEAQVGFKPMELAKVGPKVCSTPDAEIEKVYPDSEDDHRTYLCLDVAYQYALLTEGFGLPPDKEVQLVSKIPFNGQPVEAAWPMGDALEVMGDLMKKQADAVAGTPADLAEAVETSRKLKL